MISLSNQSSILRSSMTIPWYNGPRMQPSDLESAVKRQSWEWLFDLPPRLNVAIEVIDTELVPVFPPGSTRAAAALRRILTNREPSLVSAISNALRSETPAGVEADRLQVLCCRLSQGGVLVLARELSGNGSAADARQDLELVGSWLTGTIEASLSKPPNAIIVETYRIASLQRILTEAIPRGSVRKVVGAFVEALGVWDNVRVRVYAGGPRGGFFPYVSPVAALPSAVPHELEDAFFPRHGGMVRLSQADATRLALAADPGDVLVLRLFTGTNIEWLFVFSGAIDGSEQVRLSLYSDMLRESLNEILTTATNRVVAAVTQHQFQSNGSLEEATHTVVGQLAAALGSHQAALVVTTTAGEQLLAIGNTDLLPPIDNEGQLDRLVVASSDVNGVTAVVVAREHQPFTAFEREIVQAAVSVLHPRLHAVLQPSREGERRRRFRPVDTLFDQLADDAVGAGQQASVIVVAVDGTGLRPGLMQTWLGQIRLQLREGDFAGILSDREMAVLLCGASADQAAVVSARLRQLIESSDNSTDAFLQPVLGITTRSPGSTFQGSLVGAARAGAAAVR
jgi:hypothetical protein